MEQSESAEQHEPTPGGDDATPAPVRDGETISRELYQKLEATARRLARADSTRGVITYKLKELGASEGVAGRLADQVLGGERTAERMKGLGLMLSGVGVMAVGLLFVFGVFPPLSRVRNLVLALVAGAVLIFLGIARMVSGRG